MSRRPEGRGSELEFVQSGIARERIASASDCSGTTVDLPHTSESLHVNAQVMQESRELKSRNLALMTLPVAVTMK